MSKSAEIIETKTGRWYFGEKGLYPAAGGNARNIGVDSDMSRINTIYVENINQLKANDLLTKNDTIPADKIDKDVKVKFENISDMPKYQPAYTKVKEAKIADSVKEVDFKSIKNVPHFLKKESRAESAKTCEWINWESVRHVPDFVKFEDFASSWKELEHENQLLRKECVKLQKKIDKSGYQKTGEIGSNYKINDNDNNRIINVVAEEDIEISFDILTSGFSCIVINKTGNNVTFRGHFISKNDFSVMEDVLSSANIIHDGDTVTVLGDLQR